MMSLRAALGIVVVLLLPAACAPAPTGRGEPIAAPRLTDGAYIAADGASLPLTPWPAKEPRAVLVALHGFNDYRRAFELSAPELAARGITVYAYDQRGFGETETAGRWAGHAALVADATGVLRRLRAHHPDRPLYLLGHSMGAAVAVGVAAREEAGELLDGVILAAPAAWGWSELNPFYRAVLWTLARVAPGWELTGRGLERVASDNHEALLALGRDPNVIKQTRIDAIYGLVDLMEHALDAAPDVRVPALALYGEKDEIVPRHAIDALIARLPEDRTSVCGYPEGWHLLLRDLGRNRVIADIVSFIVTNTRNGLYSGRERRATETGGARGPICGAAEKTGERDS